MDAPKQRAESQILFCVARRKLDAEAVIRLRDLLDQSLDWEYLQNIARDQGLLPLLALHVISHGADLIEPAVLDRLRAELVTNRQSNLYLMRELVRVLSGLKSAGIPALVFKGPLLARLAYDDTGLRQAGDLDILIHPGDFHRAAKVLRELAYKIELEMTPAQERARFRHHCEIQFEHEDLFSVVDLHWGITPKAFPLSLTADDFLTNPREFVFAGHPIETFTDEDLIFYLSVHAAKHYFRKLEWLTTIAELIRSRPELNWTAIIAKARKTKAERVLVLALMLVESLYEIPLPADVSDFAGQSELRNTAGIIRANLLTNMAVPNQFQAFRWNLRFLPKKDAYRALMHAAFVPTISDWRAFRLPDALYPVYYLLRPVRLLAKYGGGAEE